MSHCLSVIGPTPLLANTIVWNIIWLPQALIGIAALVVILAFLSIKDLVSPNSRKHKALVTHQVATPTTDTPVAGPRERNKPIWDAASVAVIAGTIVLALASPYGETRSPGDIHQSNLFVHYYVPQDAFGDIPIAFVNSMVVLFVGGIAIRRVLYSSCKRRIVTKIATGYCVGAVIGFALPMYRELYRHGSYCGSYEGFRLPREVREVAFVLLIVACITLAVLARRDPSPDRQ